MVRGPAGLAGSRVLGPTRLKSRCGQGGVPTWRFRGQSACRVTPPVGEPGPMCCRMEVPASWWAVSPQRPHILREQLRRLACLLCSSPSLTSGGTTSLPSKARMGFNWTHLDPLPTSNLQPQLQCLFCHVRQHIQRFQRVI